MPIVAATSAASASARVTMPAQTVRSGRSRRRTGRSTRSSSRTAEERTIPRTSSNNPVVCRKIASRTSGLAATSRRACFVASLASTRSVNSSAFGLAKAALRSLSNSPLEASSATTRSMTRWRTIERAISSGSGPASALSTRRAISGAESTSSTADSNSSRQARAAVRAEKKAARPAAPARPERCSWSLEPITRYDDDARLADDEPEDRH